MEKDKKGLWFIVKRFFEPVKKDCKPYLRASVSYTLWTLGMLVTILFLQSITKTIETGDRHNFYILISCFGGFVLIYQTVKLFVRNRGRVELTTKTPRLIYTEYIKKFIQLDNTSVEKIGTGRLISIIEKGFATRNELLLNVFWLGNRILLSFIFFGYIIWKTNSLLFLGFAISFIALHILLNYFNMRILQNKRLCNPIRNEYVRNLVRIIMSKFEIMVQKKQNNEITKLNNNTDELYKLTRKRATEIQLLYAIPETFVSILWIIMFLIVGIGILNGHYTFTNLVVFATTLGYMDRVLDLSSSTVKDFFAKFSDVEQLRNTFDKIENVKGYDTGDSFTYKKGDISIKNVDFAYNKKSVFQNFSLDIIGSTRTAFVGESGGGKTTLIKLLAGYIRPDVGEIVIDQQNLSQTKLTDYYKHIGYLTQDPSVFDGTIYENLAYALDVPPTDKEIKNVIHLSKCDFVREFEKGLETEIGERGVRLSGGQKQRLAIAKIMLKNPNIILLDEPTSALDSFNEELINIALHNLFKGKTVVVVAHRLQTVKQADRILLLEQGKIQEEGTHDELVTLNGKYKKMLDLQSGF